MATISTTDFRPAQAEAQTCGCTPFGGARLDLDGITRPRTREVPLNGAPIPVPGPQVRMLRLPSVLLAAVTLRPRISTQIRFR